LVFIQKKSFKTKKTFKNLKTLKKLKENLGFSSPDAHLSIYMKPKIVEIF